MRRYAGQILNDGLREFDAQVNAKKQIDAGLEYVKYSWRYNTNNKRDL